MQYTYIQQACVKSTYYKSPRVTYLGVAFFFFLEGGSVYNFIKFASYMTSTSEKVKLRFVDFNILT